MQQQNEKKSKGLPKRLFELRGNTPQSIFSREIGVIQQTYAQWELGDRQPKLQELVRLAKHFGVSTDWLLDLTDIKSQPQNENGDSDLLSRLNAAEAEVRKYKTAFAKITKSLKATVETIEELQEA